MFLKGRRKTGLLRGTAGVGAALMLAGLYRPALATVPETTTADAKGSASRPGAPPAAAAGPPPATATAPSAERVRGAIVPVAVKLDKGGMGTDPWALFDGDAASAFKTGQPVRVRVSLPKGVALEAIGLYGGNGAVVTASADGAAKPIAGLEKIAADKLAPRWNRFSATAPVETSSLLLDITPAPGQVAEVPELELWGKTAPSERPTSSRGWAEALLTHLPAGAVQAVATPASATIAAPQLGPAGHVPFTVDLDRAARNFERAFLVYELEGMTHWSAVVRRVNWQAPQGGFHAVHAARHGLQVEEISPDWLREGRNELQFIVANVNDLVGYKVKNLRVVGVPAAGNPAARAQIETPRADKVASALVDGSRETGLTNKDLRRPQAIDFRFAETSQPDSLMVAVDKGAKGTLTAQAIVKGQVERGSQVGAELDQLGIGWARIPLDSLPANADGIRVTLRGARGETTGGLVSELRVTGSRLPTRRVSEMRVTYPLHGECVDGEAYIRGFLRGDAAGGIKGASLRIGGAKRPDALKWDGSFSVVVPPPAAALRSGGKWQVELEASFANGDATGAVVDVEGCKEPVVASKKTGPVDDEGAPFGQVVRAGESAKLSFAGATLEIPAGALDDDTRITIRPITDFDIPATDESLTNVTAGGRAYRLGPHGLKFGSPIKLTIPFDRSRFVGGQAEDDMGAYFFDEEAKRWRQVQTLKGDASAQLLTAATNHFTDFIAATISMPDHPTADSFNPNAIKDLKAADPAAGINLIAPPEASPDGAAHLSFPIWVPPGRQGMQPSLAVTYNSNAGNGLMGIGWSLPISAISVDTRFGVGRYSRTEETERYEIDGEMLVQDPCDSAPCQPRQHRTNYHRKAEGKFDTIIRIAQNVAGPIEELPIPGGGDNAYHWEVLDKRGTRYIYGETYDARGSLSQRGIFRWYLSRVIDAFGNQILYTYDKQSPLPFVQSATDLPTVRVLPKTIQYTADANGQNAHYRVEFSYDGQTSGDVQLTSARPDEFTEARGGTLEVNNVRLARIQVFENPKTGIDNIRRYDFPYIVGSFDKSLLFRIIVAQGGPPGDPDNPGGNEFYRHQFNYYQVVKNQTTGHIAFDAPVAWPGGLPGKGLSDGETDSVNGSVAGGGSVAGCDFLHGVIGGSTSVSVPLPLPPIIADHNKNEDTANRELVDVNGDGLPDFVSPGGVQLNRGDATYSSNRRAFVPGGDQFRTPGSVHVADHSSVGANASVHFLFEAGHRGFARVWGSSGDNALLSDIDGDGFVDYLKNDGSFSLNSNGQGFAPPGPGWGTLPQTDFMSADVVQQQKDSFTLTEPISMWTAPFSGYVDLSGFLQKVPNSPSHPHADGVRVIVDSYRPGLPDQFNNPTSTRTSFATITVNDTAFHSFPNGPTNFFVRRNDRIYFRVNAIDDIDDDTVTWDPVITYRAVSNDVGSNRHDLTGVESQFPEPFSGAAYTFVQGGDMRLAGQPVPTWSNESAGPDPAKVIIKTAPRNAHPNMPANAGGWKDATSDEIKVEVFLAPNGDLSAAQSITPSDFQTTYSADAGPFNPLQLTVPGLNAGDQIFFQVSSPTPIDPNQIDWQPHVEYINYCRRNTLPANSNDFTNQTTYCGGVVNCASATGCELAGDPNAAANHIAATTISQDIPVYFKLIPWQQAGSAVGFSPPGNGTVTLTGTFQSTVPARLVARGLERLAAQATASGNFQGTQVPAPVMTFSVTTGNVIMFDAFSTNANVDQDPVRWAPHLRYDGPGGPIDTDIIFARRYYPNSGDQGAGTVHGWRQLERYVDPSQPIDDPDFDVKFQQSLVKPPSGVDKNNPNVKVAVSFMRQAPEGLQVPPPGVSVPGPLWAGTSVDGYIGEGVFKPSRSARPINGSRVAFSSSNSTATDNGTVFLFGTATDYSVSSTDLAFVDMNGDHYPDLVRPDGIQFNRPQFDPTNPSNALGGHFDGKSPIRGSQPTNNPLKNLELSDGRQVSESLGVSSAVRAGMRLSGKKGSEVPGWVSLLPSLGISYGNTQTIARLLDINGDGLPDYVRRDDLGNLIVRLNIGFRPDDPDHAYEFTGDIQYAVATWSQTGSSLPVPSNIIGDALSVVPGTDFSTAIQNSVDFTKDEGKNGLNSDFRGLRSDGLRVQSSAGNNIGAGYSYFGGNLTYGLSRTTTDMIDINGDGMPDMVKRDPGSSVMSVAYNRGNTFTEEQFWDVPSWPTLQDGWVQQLQTAGFGSADALEFTQTHGQSESAGFSRYWQFTFFCAGFEVGVGAGQSFTGTDMRFEDIDGDGAPDQVLKIGCNDQFNSSGCDQDTNLYVRRNPAHGTLVNDIAGSPPNLLANVFGPLGGEIDLSYLRTGNVVDVQNHVDMPNRQNVLIRTSVSSSTTPGSPIQDTPIQTLFDYGIQPSTDVFRPTSEPSGFFDRVNREFLGFSHVTSTRFGDGLQIQSFYDNTTYAGRHHLLRQEVRDTAMTGGPMLFTRTVHTYDNPRQVFSGSNDSLFIPLLSEQTFFYEGLTNDPNAPVRSTTVKHDYDAAGNPISMSDLGDDDPAVPGDDIHYAIDYQCITDPATGATFPRPRNVFACSVPVTPVTPPATAPCSVPPAGTPPPCPVANTLRHRTGTYGPHGEMLTLIDDHFGGKDPATGNTYVINQTDPLVYGFFYDGFGNLQTSVDPTGYNLVYTYDTTTNSHIRTIRDQFGYQSTREYDSRFGSLRDTTDVNGYRMHFDSDIYGRTIDIFGPQDIGTIPPTGFGSPANATVDYTYAIPGANVSVGQPFPIFWALTKNKDASHPTDTIDTVVLVDGLGRVRQTKKDAVANGVTTTRILSSRTTFDQVGRVFQEGFPAFDTGGVQTGFSAFPNVAFAKTYAYDVLGRVRAVQTPDNKGPDIAPDGAKVVTTKYSFDPKTLDGRTQLTKTAVDPQGKIRTQYRSPRGEILAVSEQNRLGTSNTLTTLTTRYTYDRLSELLQVEDPTRNAANLTTATYDSLGNMVFLKSPDSGQTEWRYDLSGRLGAKETANLRAKNQLIQFTYEFNRIKTIVYPPASAFPGATGLVTYTYGTNLEAGPSFGNIAGRLATVTDESGKETRQYDSLGNISHTEKTPMTLSPSIPPVTYKMDYAYDQLGRMQTMTYPDGEIVSYGYNAGGLVNSVKGQRASGTQTTYVSDIQYNELEQRSQLFLGNGWGTTYVYYPDTKRLQGLKTANGSAQVQNTQIDYDLVGNITGLANNLPTLAPVAPNTVIAPGPSQMGFAYDDLYQLKSATGSYTGCACGCGNSRTFGLTYEYDGLENITRKNQTDTIKQPTGSVPQAATTYNNVYTYGSSRPHAPTAVGPSETISYDADGNQTQYSGSFGPSRSLTWTEDDRLRSETDSGFTNTFLYDAGGNRSHKRRTTLETWYVNANYVVKNSLTESKHIMLGNDRVVTAVATITNRADPKTAGTNTLFYYHPDHIQSTSYVTGGDGSILQHDEYFPGGEVWFQEQKNNDARNTQPYLFNAKELDETGLYYFGARYYNPKFSVWISADPILASYMQRGPTPRNMGLYSYGLNNPVILKDPDGLAPGLATPGGGQPPLPPSVVYGETAAAESDAVAQGFANAAERTAFVEEVATAEAAATEASTATGLGLGLAPAALVGMAVTPGFGDTCESCRERARQAKFDKALIDSLPKPPASFPPRHRGSAQAPAVNPDDVMSLPPPPNANACIQAPGAPATSPGGMSLRGGESPSAARGRAAHKNYGTALGPEWDTGVILPSGKKPDAVNWRTREVRELKPDNQKAMKKGQRQVEEYRQELEAWTGQTWTTPKDVDVYRSK